MKRYRSMKIKEIIQHQIIETQEELAAALKREGIIVTQATVSSPQRNRGSCLRTIHHFFSKKRLSELKAA